MKCKWKKVCRK